MDIMYVCFLADDLAADIVAVAITLQDLIIATR